MAGRKQFDVDKALTGAMLVFWEHGYDAASLAMLGGATGLGKGSLYGTFGSKQELFIRCLQRYAETYRPHYETALAGADPVRAVDAFYDVTIRRMLDPSVPGGCLVAQSAALAGSLPPAARAAVSALLDDQRATVTAALIRGGLAAPAAATMASYLVAVRQALAVLHRSGSGEGELRAVVDTARTAVASALTPRTR